MIKIGSHWASSKYGCDRFLGVLLYIIIYINPISNKRDFSVCLHIMCRYVSIHAHTYSKWLKPSTEKRRFCTMYDCDIVKFSSFWNTFWDFEFKSVFYMCNYYCRIFFWGEGGLLAKNALCFHLPSHNFTCFSLETFY